MGSYVYRVTGERVMCSDGVEARVAEFAYKPYWGDDAANRKMHWKSGAQASDNAAARNPAARIAIGGAVFANPNGYGSFYDDGLGGDNLPRLREVKAPEFPPLQLWRNVVKLGKAVDADVATIAEAPGVKRCISAVLKREPSVIPGMGAIFVMRCHPPGGKPMEHSISVSSTDINRLAVHWAGFLQNCRARARELYVVSEAA